MSEQVPEAGASKSSFWTVVLTGFVSLVVGVGSGVLINYFTEKHPKLTYDITTQEIFPGQQNNTGIFAVRIENSGKREIEQLECHLRFADGEVMERTIAGLPDSARRIVGGGNEITITVPFLNPGEKFSVHALLRKVKPPFVRPEIDLRGRGVLGLEAPTDKATTDGFVSTGISVLTALLTAFITLKSAKDRKISLTNLAKLEATEIPTAQSGDQRDLIAFALESNALPDDARVIRQWPRKITFWAASDFLAAEWLRAGDRKRTENGLKALSFLVDYARISDDSKRIVILNMAKLAFRLGEIASAGKYLASVQKTADKVAEKRIQADPDLSKLKAAG